MRHRTATRRHLVALIAHDGKKEAMANLVREHCAVLERLTLVATHTTGGVVEAAGDGKLAVRKMLSGPLGGDLQIGALIAEGLVHTVIFLRDPLQPHPHEPDISALMKVCDTHEVPLATNLATAQLLLHRLETSDPGSSQGSERT